MGWDGWDGWIYLRQLGTLEHLAVLKIVLNIAIWKGYKANTIFECRFVMWCKMTKKYADGEVGDFAQIDLMSLKKKDLCCELCKFASCLKCGRV